MDEDNDSGSNSSSFFEIFADSDSETPSFAKSIDSDDISDSSSNCNTSNSEEQSDEDNSGDGSNINEIRWSIEDVERKLEAFESTSGIQIYPNLPKCILSVVCMFIDDSFFKMICVKTNNFVEKYEKQPGDPVWSNLSVPELKKWFGLLLEMDVLVRQNMKNYWSKNSLRDPIFNKTMSLARFKAIMFYLHFSDSLDDDESLSESDKKLFMMKNVVDYFSQRFDSIFKPNRDIWIYEYIFPWSGESAYVTNVGKCYESRSDYHHIGMLMKLMCDTKLGYIFNFKLYPDIKKVDITDDFNNFYPNYLNKWHHFYFDTYTLSLELTNQLLDNKIRSVGYYCSKKLPKALVYQKLNQNESAYVRADEILMTSYKTSNDENIYMISTIHDKNVLNNVNNFIEFKNKIMPVGPFYEYIKYFKFKKKTDKWTNKILFQLLYFSLFNAYRIYMELNRECEFTFRKFIGKVIHIWIDSQNTESSSNDEEVPVQKKRKKTE